MKLNGRGFRSGNVQSLGDWNISAPQNVANQGARFAEQLGQANVNLANSKGMVVREAIEVVDGIVKEAGNTLGRIAADDAAHYQAEADQRGRAFAVSMQQPSVTAEQASRMGVDVSRLTEYGDTIPTHKIQAHATAKFIRETKEEARNTMSDRAYDLWEPEFSQKADVLQMRTQSGILEKEISFRKNRVIEDSQILLNQGDTAKAVAMVSSSASFTEQEKSAVIQKYRQQGAQNDVELALTSKDPQQMQQVVNDLLAGDYSVLSPGAVRKNVNMLKEAQHRAGAARRAAIEKARSKKVTMLQAGIKGVKGIIEPFSTLHRDIDEAYNAGIIKTEKEWLRLHDMITQHSAQQTQDSVDSTNLDAALSGDINLSPYEASTQKAVDARYDSNPSPEEGLYLTKKIGVVPSNFQKELIGNLTKGKPEEQVRAARWISAVRETGVVGIRKFPKEVMLRQQLLESLSPNIDNEDAVAMVDKQLNMPKSEIDQRKRNFAAFAKDSPAADLVEGFMDADENDQFDINMGPWSEVSWEDIPAELQGDFLAIQKSAFITSGDFEQSTKYAYNVAIRDVADAERINGNERVIKNAPHREYNLSREEVEHDWDEFKKYKSLPEDSVYVSDFKTGREKIGQKTWAVYARTEDGGLIDMQQRWAPVLAIKRRADEAAYQQGKQKSADAMAQKKALENQERINTLRDLKEGESLIEKGLKKLVPGFN